MNIFIFKIKLGRDIEHVTYRGYRIIRVMNGSMSSK